MFAPVVALVGLTGSGIVSGLALSYPLLINTHLIDQQGANISPPTPWAANLDTAQRLTLWERAYKAGRELGAAQTAAAGFGSFDFQRVPFTVVAILPINKKLMALRKAANNKEPVNENEVDSLFKKWARLQNVRVTASVSSFVLALYSFIAV
ncbi:hypothetical protein NDA11_000481 [Ustilago hordei]|nr:hypothetical protein NDA12_006008 [Ustilago hordei]KAJ1580191.1 hypothetical protein NDA11_000481 [Ustilago hordei]KAJ1599546.1 hypothetical protein NDA14_004395 [Ustilago hordei]